MVQNYEEFLDELLKAGFSLGGGSAEGIFAIVDWNWITDAPDGTNVQWHTGDIEHDPWEWRMRVLDERKDIAYAKIFFKKSGFVTREWYPYFMAARRGGLSFGDAYAAGKLSHFAKRIYDMVAENGALPSHMIKQMGAFGREDKAAFDRALVELQMGMYLTMCGSADRVSLSGGVQGWSSNVMCTVEEFFGIGILEEAREITPEQAYSAIASQVMLLNPMATEKKVRKFVFG